MSDIAMPGPHVGEQDITFRVADADRRFAQVALVQEIERPRVGPEFALDERATWILRWRRPPALRMEYKLNLVHRDGGAESVCDPANPLRASGPFGDKSVLELPGCQRPDWLDADPPSSGSVIETSVESAHLGGRVRVRLWRREGWNEPRSLPLLVVHDGPEYEDHASLIVMLEHMTARSELPPMQAALLAPLDRSEHYSPSTTYSRALIEEVLPQLERISPSPPGNRMRIGMGASLGALAMLHAHRLHPDVFGGLFLQSGSFFSERLDDQESWLGRFGDITRFMNEVRADTTWTYPMKIEMTCGSVEENLVNNRATEAALGAQGYEVALHEHPDAHNWVSWRDTFDPFLVDFLGAAWG
ncbi:MAG: alpha/beta hydrolase-fold protein [Actinomycetota bacterium]|nr:alpha/beta hydrolase-fold protein [Actinomycetota bacterium]